jgi:hypothetical protein
MAVMAETIDIIAACNIQKSRRDMKKSELLRALQTEIEKHNLSTFMDEKDKVVITGCTLCRKHFGTVEQFERHITEDALPLLLDKLSSRRSSDSF